MRATSDGASFPLVVWHPSARASLRLSGQRVNKCSESINAASEGASFWRASERAGFHFPFAMRRGSVSMNAASDGESFPFFCHVACEQESELSLPVCDVSGSVSMNAASKGASFPNLVEACHGGECEQESEIYVCSVAWQCVNEFSERWGEVSFCGVACERERNFFFQFAT